MRQPASSLAIWSGILVLYVVWGSTYLGMKLAIDSVPPFVMGFLRFVPAGLILAGAMAVREGSSFRRPTLRELRDSAVIGTMLLLGGTGLVAWAQQSVPTGIAALLIGLLPMWLAVFGRALFGERIPRLALVGIVVGLAGVGVLAWPVGGVGRLDAHGLAALLVSPMLWGLGSLYAARRAVQPRPALFAVGLQMVFGGLAFLVPAGLTGDLAAFDPTRVSPTSWFGIAYLVGVGSLVGYTTYAWLLGVAPLGRISTYAYVNPVVAVFLGWLILGESLTPRTFLAAAIIVVAVALIVTGRSRAGGRAAPGREAVEVEPGPQPAAAAPDTGARAATRA